MNLAYILAAVAFIFSCAALFFAAMACSRRRSCGPNPEALPGRPVLVVDADCIDADGLASVERGDIIPIEVPAGKCLSDLFVWVELPKRKR